MPDRCAVGIQGENVAAAALQRAGYTVLARRWRPHGVDLRGDIDLVVQKGGGLAFVEVRSRLTDDLSAALESVSARKRQRMAMLGAAYLMINNVDDCPVQYMLMVVNPRTGKYELVEDALDHAASW